MASIAVIDYGMGNLHSIAKALEKVAPDAWIQVTSDLEVLQRADKLVLPGVGAIRPCINELHRLEMDELLCQLAREKPLLGICLGMQVLLSHSEENDGTDGLGIMNGNLKRFEPSFEELETGQTIRIPHMGWNRVRQVCEHPLWQGIPDQSRFYFVHSYYAEAQLPDTVGETDYGVTFSSVLARDNVFAVQFHPEKSQHAGLKLLSNFAHWDGVS